MTTRDPRLARCAAALGMRAALGAALASRRARRTRPRGPSNDLLIVGYDREPDTMNRYATHILEDIQSCVVEGLVTSDEQMNIVPVLAAEIPTLENGGVVLRPDGGMDVTWKLRPGVKWHDGKPHTSADVKFTVDAINKGDWKPESTDGFDRIASVDTPDSLTAVVHYKEVYAPYQMQFFRGTLPKHVLDGRDIDKANDYNRARSAPARIAIAEWKTGEYVLLEKVPDYWRGAEYPKIDRILFRFLANTTTRINQLKSGEVHMVALVPWDKVRELRGVAVAAAQPGARQRLRARDAQRAPLPAVRGRARAPGARARDRSRAARAHDPRQPRDDGERPDPAAVVGVRAERARVRLRPGRGERALLDDAGWKRGADGIRAKDGKPLAFTLITQAGFAIRENVAQALQRQFRDVGVNA